MSSSRNKFTLLYQNSVTDVFVGFRPPCWCPSRWAPAWRLCTNLCKFEEFEAGRSLAFSAFRMGAYSGCALIQGWALIRINTVLVSLIILFGLEHFPFSLLAFFCDNIITNNSVYIHCILEQLRPQKVL